MKEYRQCKIVAKLYRNKAAECELLKEMLAQKERENQLLKDRLGYRIIQDQQRKKADREVIMLVQRGRIA